jgi:hypothetical protein
MRFVNHLGFSIGMLSLPIASARPVMRYVAIVLCLLIAHPASAQRKRDKGKPRPEPVIELDAWGKPQPARGEQLLIWQDEAGWHIRAHAGGKRRAKFSGTVRVIDGKVKRLWGFHELETKGKVQDIGIVSKDQKQISFQLKLSGAGEDGFDFSLTPTASQLEISMLVDGFDHPEKIRIGANGYRASGTKFLIPVAVR